MSRFPKVFNLFHSHFYCVGYERISKGGDTLDFTFAIKEERVGAIEVGGTSGGKVHVTSQVILQGTEMWCAPASTSNRGDFPRGDA